MVLKPGLDPIICDSALIDPQTDAQKPAHVLLYSQAARHLSALLESMPHEALYCKCEAVWDPKGPTMVLCEKCEEWFHLDCVGLEGQADSLPDEYFCTSCD
jgi:hypothetical protein